MAALAAAGIAAAGSALASGISKLGARYKKKIAAQEAAQQRLNAEAARMNYEYGEMAADSAHQRSLGLIEATNLENQVEDARNAGLSPGLLYGGTGGGATGGGATGTGARGVQPPEAADRLAEEEGRLQAKALAVDIQRVINESLKVRAEKNQIEAETELIKEQTETSKELTPLQIANLNEEGFGKFIENAIKEYELSGGNQTEREFPIHTRENEKRGWNVNISPQALFTEERAAQVAKAISEKEGTDIQNMLKTQEAKIAWRQLLIAEANSENDRIRTLATKLAAEWGTGEYTNWKTWVSAAGTGIGAISQFIK